MQKPASRIWTLMARKLNNEISVEELQELGQLLRKHPDEHYAVEIITEQWNHSRRANVPELESSYEKLLSKIQDASLPPANAAAPRLSPAFPRIRPLAMIIVAASVCIACFLIDRRYFSHASSKPEKISVNQVSTRHGSKTKLILPDSTQVWLNSGSMLTYDNNFDQINREVTLVGEAYFDVEKNPDKPFIIHTNRMDIRVLGTAFNVKSYPGDSRSETSLIRGSLEVILHNPGATKVVLKPSEKLVLSDAPPPAASLQNQATKQTNASQQFEPQVVIQPVTYDEEKTNVVETSWVNNKLIFNHETFEDLAIQMERWYGVTIRFNDRSLIQNRFTGIFENETVQQALEALRFTTKFKYVLEKNKITIFK